MARTRKFNFFKVHRNVRAEADRLMTRRAWCLSTNGYAAFYYSWIPITDPNGLTGSNTILAPPCGHIAGIYARVRALGQVNITIGMAPVFPAEFVIVTIGLWDGGSSNAEQQGKLAMAGTAQRTDAFRDDNFLVEMDGVTQPSFMECSGLEASTEVIETRQGGDDTTVYKLPGKTSYGDMTLKWGTTASTELASWRQDVIDGIINRKNGSVVLYDLANQTEVATDTSAPQPRHRQAKTGCGRVGLGCILRQAHDATRCDPRCGLDFGLGLDVSKDFCPFDGGRRELSGVLGR